MFGFSALLGQISSLNFTSQSNSNGILKSDNYICFNNMINKFQNDKLFQEDDNYLIILDGVVLNKHQVMSKYKGLSWFEVVIKLYQQSDTFFDEFRGSFSGVLYDKQRDRYIIFSDHIGTKFIYYTHTRDNLFVSSMMSEVYSFLKQNNIPYNLSIENAYLLLSYGYMLEDRTLCEEIKKIQPGHYLLYENNKLQEIQYFLLDNTPDNTITEKDAIEIMDKSFRSAVKLQFEKDKEYGYKHVVALSAGLDSRMTSWVAHELGYTDQLNITFSQSNYWDEIIPKKIASDLKHEWLFKALDNGLWLKDIDDITRITGGNVLYFGLAHGNSLMKYMNFNDLGLIHSGQVGDVVFGTFYSSKDINKKFSFGQGAYSKKYLSKLNDFKLKSIFVNEEITNFYYRGFSGANNGLLIDFNYTETISPFYDIDLLNVVLKIPVKYRYNHDIYKKWILAKYPKAAEYVWEKMGCRIDRKFGLLNIAGRKVAIEKLPIKVLNKLSNGKFSGIDNKKHMNPIGYYLNSNKELTEYIDKYFDDNVGLITNNYLKKDILEIKNNNNSIEKIQAISLLSALKMFYK